MKGEPKGACAGAHVEAEGVELWLLDCGARLEGAGAGSAPADLNARETPLLALLASVRGGGISVMRCCVSALVSACGAGCGT